MWVTENDHVGRVTPDGQITQYSVTTNWYVWDIVSLRSSLVFTEPGTNEMGRVWPNGGLREVTIPKAIVVPWALAVSDGQLWITEQSQIAIITP
jgi:virginiamycin B lyase